MQTCSTRSSSARDARGRGERVVGLELDHRPDGDAHRRERLLERMELRAQRRVDAVAGLVAGPEVVAERLDDVVGRDADVRRAASRPSRAPCAARRPRRRTAGRRRAAAAQAVEVAEQLVGAVDEVDDHQGTAPYPTGASALVVLRRLQGLARIGLLDCALEGPLDHLEVGDRRLAFARAAEPQTERNATVATFAAPVPYDLS